MSSKLIETSIKEVTEGAKLGLDVLDHQGQLLMPAGATLSLSAIDRLISREITHVTVVEKEVMTEEQFSVLKSEIEMMINHRFRKANSSPLMQELKQALIDHRIKELNS